MEDFKTIFNILAEILDKKLGALVQILSITENQQLVLQSLGQLENAAEIFHGMNEEKQRLIPTVIDCDSTFQSIFERFHDIIDEEADNHKLLVNDMQKRIKAVLDLDIKIRVQEEKNKTILATGKSSTSMNKTKIDSLKISKKNLLEQYKQYRTNKDF